MVVSSLTGSPITLSKVLQVDRKVVDERNSMCHDFFVSPFNPEYFDESLQSVVSPKEARVLTKFFEAALPNIQAAMRYSPSCAFRCAMGASKHAAQITNYCIGFFCLFQRTTSEPDETFQVSVVYVCSVQCHFRSGLRCQRQVDGMNA